MLQWFRKNDSQTVEKNGNSNGNGSSNDMHNALMVKLIEYLENQISAPRKSASILSHVARFKELPASYRVKELPELYLKLEHYLCDEDPMQKFTRLALRKTIQYRYEPLMQIESFSVIFEEKKAQQFLLCKFYLQKVLQSAEKSLQKSDNTQFLSKLQSWLDRAPSNNTENCPLKLESQNPQDMDKWIDVFREFSEKLFAYIADKLGEGGADSIFENNFFELASIYGPLDTFYIVLDLLPNHLITQEKVDLLPPYQVKQFYFNKIQQLKPAEASVEDQQAKLEQLAIQLKATENSMLESVGLLDLLMNSVREGVITTDEKGTILAVNHSVLQLLGYENEEELLNKNVNEIFDPSSGLSLPILVDNENQTESIARIGKPQTAKIYNRSRQTVDCELVLHKAEINEKTFFLLTVFNEPLSEEQLKETKRILAQLKFYKETLRVLMNNLPEIALTINSNGIIKTLNPAFEQFTGWDRNDWIGKPFKSLLKDDSEKEFAQFLDHLGENKPLTMSAKLKKSDNGELPVTIKLCPEIIDEQVIGAVALIQPKVETQNADAPEFHEKIEDLNEALRSLDLALQEKSEHLDNLTEELRLAESRFFKMMNLSDVGMGIHTNGRLALINEVAAKMLGAKAPTDIMDKHMMDFIAAEDRESFQELVFRLLKSGESIPETVLNMKTINNEVVTVKYKAVPVIYESSHAIQFSITPVQNEVANVSTIDNITDTEEILNTVVQAAPVAVVICDESGVIAKFSDDAAEMVGEDSKKMQNKNFIDFVAEEFRSNVREAVFDAVDDKVVELATDIVNSVGVEQTLQLTSRKLTVNGQSYFVIYLKQVETDSEKEHLQQKITALQQQIETLQKASEAQSAEAVSTAESSEEVQALQAKISELTDQLTSLSEQNNRSYTELNAAKEQIQNKESELMDSNAKISELEAQIKRLTESSEETRKKLEALNAEYEQTQKKLAEARAALVSNQQTDRQIKTNAAMMQAKLQNTQMKLHAVQAEYDGLVEKLQQTKNEFESYQEKLNSAKETLESLESRIKVVNENVEQSEARLVQINEELTEKQHRLTEVEKALSEKSDQLEILKNDVNASKAKLETLQDTIAGLKTEKIELENRIDQLKDQEKQLQEKLEDYNKEIVLSEEKRTELTQAIAALDSDIQQKTQLRERLTTEIDSAETKIKELREKITTKEDILQKYRAHKEELEAKISRLESDCTTAEAELKRLSDAVSGKQAEIESLTTRRRQILDELEAAEEKLNNVRSEQQRIEAEFSQKYGSVESLEAKLKSLTEAIEKERQRVAKLRELFPIGPNKQIREDQDYWQRVWEFADDPDNEDLFKS
jgi:PAS domain S-box-containing protein